jgi:hypothetical protein
MGLIVERNSMGVEIDEKKWHQNSPVVGQLDAGRTDPGGQYF